jgi:alpha-tubulin suppressor-like RCC1 family protein
MGDLGTGNTADTAVPTPVVANDDGTAYKEIASGGDHNCAIDTAGALWCWGNNATYQLGMPNTGATTRPYPIRVGCQPENDGKNCFSDWQLVAAGWFHTCAIRAQGQLYCWGGNLRGQVGNGQLGTDVQEPTQIGPGVTWQNVFCGRSHTCALDTELKLYCWGDNAAGQGARSEAVIEPAPIEFDTDQQWQTASLGEYHTCAVRSVEESLWCWGDNAAGQLGIGTTGGIVGRPTRVCLP